MEKIAVHINSEEESKLVQEEFFRRGLVWLDGEKTYASVVFARGNKDCYFAESNSYTSDRRFGVSKSEYWRNNGYTLIEAHEFLNKDEPKQPGDLGMPKLKPEDVKPGMILGHRCEGCQFDTSECCKTINHTDRLRNRKLERVNRRAHVTNAAQWMDGSTIPLYCPLEQCFIVKDSKETINKPDEAAKPQEALPEIKPCYCGNKPEYITYSRIHKLVCKKCDVGAQSDSLKNAIETWNNGWAVRPPVKANPEPKITYPDRIHCQHCGALLGVEWHTNKCPEFRTEVLVEPWVAVRAERRKFYENLKGRDIPKRILGPGAKRLKSFEEIEGD